MSEFFSAKNSMLLGQAQPTLFTGKTMVDVGLPFLLVDLQDPRLMYNLLVRWL